MSRPGLLVLALLLAAGCGKKDEDTPAGAPPVKGEKLATPAGGGGRTGAEPPPGQDQSGGAANTAPTVSDCPARLGGSETVNRVLPKGCQTVVEQDYHINGGQIVIEAGVTLRLRDGVTFNVGYSDAAKLIVQGTAEAPVTFTAAGDKVAGAWLGVNLFQHADRSQVDHLIIEYAGRDGEALKIEAEDVVMTSSTVRHSKVNGMSVGLHGSLARFTGNTFEDIAKFPVSLGAATAGGLGEGNTFPAGSVVQIYGGTITSQVKWSNVGAPFYIAEDVHIEGEQGLKGSLEIAPGVEVRMGAEAQLIVGYSSPAAMRAVGSDAAPVKFTALDPNAKAGAWPAVRVSSLGEGTFDHVTFEDGGAADDGALQVDGDGSASVTACTFRRNTIGVVVGERSKLRAFDRNLFEGNDKAALSVWAAQLGALGSGNRYGAKERIQLRGGRVVATTTWHAQGAAIEVLDALAIDGRTTLTIEAGATFLQKDKTYWEVGASDAGSIKLLGTAERPITFAGLRDEPGAWFGIWLRANSRDSVIQNVVVRDAGMEGSGGVKVEGGANATVTKLACAKCAAAALEIGCLANVTATDVTPGVKRLDCK
jgi:hypothetical protein